MQSFPLARTQPAACCREESHCSTRFSRTPSQELQSPRKRRAQNPASRPRCWTACALCVCEAFWRTSSLIGSARAPQQSAHADWLGTHSERYLVYCAATALQRRSAGLAPRPAPARSPATATRHSITHFQPQPPFSCCQWVLQVARTSEAVAAACTLCTTHIARPTGVKDIRKTKK